MEKNKQNIKCDVHSCKYCDCDKNHCNLREIEVKNQSGLASEEDETLCSSYEFDKEKYEEED